MISTLSNDFKPLANSLKELYAEPSIECLTHADWFQDLTSVNHGKFISRLTFIGHSDNIYGEQQCFFGGNQHEKVMLMEEFAHLLIKMLQQNEIKKPGFCHHLQHIDLIDCHSGEKRFLAEVLANYLNDDPFIRRHGGHLKISSFANSYHSKGGTMLMPDKLKPDTLLFYSFNLPQSFAKYKHIHKELEELRTELHHLLHLPKHSAVFQNHLIRQERITELEKKRNRLEQAEKHILECQPDNKMLISDPRQYFAQHPDCQIIVSKLKTPSSRHHKASGPNFFNPKISHHVSIMEENAPARGKFHNNPKGRALE